MGELRVHGVGGTPPESLLDRPHVRQVDGDDKSRFFRAVDAATTFFAPMTVTRWRASTGAGSVQT